MEPVNTIGPTLGAQQAAVARAAPTPVVQAAVTTDLPGAKTVTATNTAGAARNDPSSNSNQADYQQTVVIDPATREVIYRVVDVRSRQVVRQIPEQALLRMRAYTHALDNGKTMAQALSQADLEV
jgi:hypothetical protein